MFVKIQDEESRGKENNNFNTIFHSCLNGRINLVGCDLSKINGGIRLI